MGSVAVAGAATPLGTYSSRYRALISETAGMGPVGRQWLERTTAMLANRGGNLIAARSQALMLLDGRIRRQAAMLAYNHVFMQIAILFVLSLPLVLLLRHAARDAVEEVQAE
jgi:DHA2 family multidrug resistance protein